MNQLFYNIAGEIVHKIRREKWKTITEVTVRGKREILSKINKIGIGFISLFLLKPEFHISSNNFKMENLSLHQSVFLSKLHFTHG